MPASRKDIRIERYRYARSLGYNAEEARKYRDYSGERLQREVRQEEKRLADSELEDLSEPERLRLRRIREHRQRENREPERRGRIETEQDRLRNFKIWSKRKAFPSDIQALIDKINDEGGYDEYDSYGYRIYYHLYVKQRTAPDAVRMVETRDT